MAKTELTVVTLKNGGRLPISAGDLEVAETAADTVNGNMAKINDGVILTARNSGASDHTITIDPPVDDHGRDGDITTYNVPAGEKHEVYLPPHMAQKSGANEGKVYFSANHAEILFSVTQLPTIKS